jgi:hypothetical protein
MSSLFPLVELPAGVEALALVICPRCDESGLLDFKTAAGFVTHASVTHKAEWNRHVAPDSRMTSAACILFPSDMSKLRAAPRVDARAPDRAENLPRNYREILNPRDVVRTEAADAGAGTGLSINIPLPITTPDEVQLIDDDLSVPWPVK